jgi:hypothetical protein
VKDDGSIQMKKNNDTAGGCGDGWATFLVWSMNGIEGFLSIVQTSAVLLAHLQNTLGHAFE